MSLLQNIYEWSLTLKPCLRDALRRLLDSPTLTETDYDDLFALLKLEAGIADPENRVPEMLDKKHLPSTAVQGATVRLLSLQNLTNVNRIAPNQKVTFEPAGLTVIYGDNGTGKSGYSRVLKLACRARGEKAVVLPNANLPKADQGAPAAEIVYDVNGTKTKVKWTATTQEHPDLATLSVFDSHCARAYLDAEQDVAYLPYGLDIVENLANVVLPRLNDRLKEALAKCVVDRKQFEDLAGTTKVGVMIAGLSAGTDKAIVEALTTFSEEETARVATLRSTLSEQNPKAKAAHLRRLVERMKKIQDNIEGAIKLVNRAALEALKELATSTKSTIAAEKLAVDIFHSGENLLPGTGGEAWQALFEAARDFAAIAYKDADFPTIGANSRCPLCQQELQDGALRLQRFDAFIKDTAATLAKRRRAELNGLMNSLRDANLSFSLDPSLIEEVEHHNAELCPSLQAFEKTIAERRRWMLDGVEDGKWENGPTIAHDPRAELTAFIQAITDESSSHELASNEETRKALELELAELEARIKCQKSKQLILDAIGKLQTAAALNSCVDHIRTLPITNKSKELINETVTDVLSKALNTEFESFGLEHLKTKLKSRAKDGKTYHKIVLDVPTTCKLADILSEGELRVMAIASFLAELSLSNHSGGAIFDDPVSSLDHFRRARVARRLADEALKRQVIVFTHDTVFLAELRGIVDREGIGAQFFHLEWTTAEYSGYCIEGLPWHHQTFKDRLDKLEQEQRRLRNEWTPVPNAQLCDRMRNAYSHFRATIERAVETIFLRNIVRRFDNYIPVAEIEKLVALTPAEFAELNRLFKLACDATNAHDPASGANRPPPSPTEFEQHIKVLSALVETFKARA